MNTHTINRQIFELKVRSQENAFGLQQQVRAAWDAEVLPLLGELLDEIAGPDEVLRIDKLEIDIGKIRAEKIGTDMKEKLREVLRTQLLKYKTEALELNPDSVVFQNKLASANEISGSKRISRVHSNRELLEYFFINAVLPWWAEDELQTIDIDELITESFAKEPVSSWQWMQQIALNSPAALRRMSLQISPAAQKQILKSAANPVPVYLEKYAERMAQLLTRSGWTAPLPEESAQLIFTSSLLLQTAETISGSVEAEAIKVYIRQLAVKMQTPAQLLERRMYEGILSYAAKAPKAELKKEKALISHFIAWEKSEPEAAATISGDEMLTLASITDGERLSISEEADRIEKILEQFFLKLEMRREMRKKIIRTKFSSKQKQNTISETADLIHSTENSFETEMSIEKAKSFSELNAEEFPAEQKTENADEIKIESAQHTKEEIEIESVQKTKRENEIQILSNSALKKDTEEETALPKRKKKSVSEIQSKKIKKTLATEEAETKTDQKKISTEENTVSAFVNKSVSNQEEILIDPLAETERTEAEIIAEEQKENEEEYFEENKKLPAGMTRFGGLALLGPFISGLFSVLKLVNETEFVSKEAQIKGVFLLHYLATGKTKAPEYALTLQKMICGMKITDTVPRKAVLTDEEKTEAGLFLDDIAEQWPTLQGSSGDAMRNTFMRRNGIIEKKENAWLLRVERNPMDIMLDTLPWSLSIIKMPWMQQALYVEW